VKDDVVRARLLGAETAEEFVATLRQATE